MPNQWRTIPRSVALTAVSLLATASFTLAPLAENGGAPARPEDDSRPVRLDPSSRDARSGPTARPVSAGQHEDRAVDLAPPVLAVGANPAGGKHAEAQVSDRPRPRKQR
jgi:hypothetical protein